MAPDILVAGALHLDVVVTAPRLPRLDETLAGRSVAYPLGGKGGNQAVAAARMGAAAAMAGRVGTDAFGAALLDALDAAGVDRRQVERVSGDSGMSVAIVTDGGAYGAVTVSGVNAAIDPARIELPAGLKVLLLQNEIPEAANLALAARARAAGIRVILNAAPMRPTAPDLIALADLLVVNRIEAADLSGVPAEGLDPGSAARALVAAGAGAAIVTLGAQGLVACDGGAPFALAAPPVTPVSSHGAGDAFIGALAAELSRGAPLRAALGFAQAAAALTVAAAPAERAAVTAAAARALCDRAAG
ncbi:MAG: PfkB family carbohydrate kinase [Rhodobacteraceae bacterium]|nr:PfkB family carbohydrate kinase [Paracoccaceae bacterium]